MKKLKEKIHMIISLDAEKDLDKIQQTKRSGGQKNDSCNQNGSIIYRRVAEARTSQSLGWRSSEEGLGFVCHMAQQVGLRDVEEHGGECLL